MARGRCKGNATHKRTSIGPYRRDRAINKNLEEAREARRLKRLSATVPTPHAEPQATSHVLACTSLYPPDPSPSSATAPTASFIYFSSLKRQQQCDLMDQAASGSKIGDVTAGDQAFTGRRVVSCASLDDCVEKISLHCHPGMHFRRCREVSYGGLHRDVRYKCSCGYEVVFSGDFGTENLPINQALSEACLITPLGHDDISTLLTTLELPVPSAPFFRKCQNESREKIDTFVEKMLLEAGREERRLAEEAGDFIFIDGKKYVWITIILDGGWPKRSYSHTYDSACGVAVIIGARTGKILYFGTRTKTCQLCSRATNKAQQPREHTCYKNWNKSSTAMEQDILLEGFRQSIPVHNVVYARFVGDGDSSVHSAVIDVYQGIKVQKIECYNHVTKNLHKKLIAISTNSVQGKQAPKIPKGERQLPGMESSFKRIGAGISGAILHHSEFADVVNQSQQLREDIRNTPFHVFGEHTNCRDYFCDPNGDRRSEDNRVAEMSKMAFREPMMKAVLYVANLAPGLIYRCNTNKAESFMSLANKYVEGKRKHLGGSFLYGLRMTCAVLTYNLSRFWLPDLFQDVHGVQPSLLWTEFKKRGILSRQQGQKKKKPKKIPKFGFLKQKRGDEFYGEEPLTPELDAGQLINATEDLYLQLQADDEKRALIELKTREQAESEDWFEERRSRITASNAGKLFKLRPTSDNTATLNQLLRTGFRVAATEYGKESEDMAIAAYEVDQSLPKGYVQRVGLLVSRKNGIFGASADGLVGEDGLLEIKCPYSLRDKKPQDWPIESKLASPLAMDENGTLSLKRNHNHFYQVVMQLYVCERDWADYAVWTPNGIFVDRIMKNSDTSAIWEKMEIKLAAFWRNDLAPEIVDPQKKRNKPYRCTDPRLVGRNRLLALKAKKAEKINT